MNGPLKDKYFLLCLSVAFIIVFSSFFIQDQDDGRIGVVSDVKESSSGYTFDFEDESSSFRCFAKEKPVNGSVYTIKGNFSDDGTMFFVSSMTLLCRE